MVFLLNCMSFPESWQWKVPLLLFGVGSVSVIGFAIALANGMADPPRASYLIWEDTPISWQKETNPKTNLEWYVSPHPLTTVNEFTLEVEGTIQADIPTLTAWGIWFQVADERWLVVGINGHQYVTVRYCESLTWDYRLLSCMPAFEPTQQIETVWKYFHLIKPVGQPNRIQLTRLALRSTTLTLRFGGEWMWDVALESDFRFEKWGIWVAQPQDSSQALVLWTTIRLWGNIEN